MLEFIGRLHPLVLHLPIGILFMAYLVEFYSLYTKKNFREVQSLILLLASISAVVSILTGLLLIRGGDYSGDTVYNHKWVAIGLGAIAISTFVLYRRSAFLAYRITLVSSAVMLGLTGHLGGTITHGENFLFESNGPDVRPNIEEAVLYSDIIYPIFKEKCISCHNPNKIKGDLDMSDTESLLRGGENGVIIDYDEPLDSKLWKYINLPESHDEHMPPEGKKQLTPEELVLIEWWLESGAEFDQLAIQSEDYTLHEDLISKYLTPPEVDIFSKIEVADSSDIKKPKLLE